MWNRGFRILWVKVHITGEHQFFLSLPISLYVFQELFDCVLDLMDFACLFVPKNPPAHLSNAISARSVKELIQATDNLFHSITHCEPYDLVEVNAKNVTVSIKIR
jgi:hypothetical protein